MIDITDLVPFSEYGSKLTPAVSFESTIIHSVPVDVGGRVSHRPWRSFFFFFFFFFFQYIYDFIATKS